LIKEGNFGPSEAIILITTTIVIKVFFSSPVSLFIKVGTAGWYATIISGLTAMLGFTFIYRLLKRFPGMDLVDIYKESFGKVLGAVVTFLFALYLFFVAESNLCEFNQTMRVYVFTLSPNWYLSGLFVISLFIISYLGLESLARVSKLLIVFVIPGLLVILILAWSNYNINNMFPILGYGLDKTILHGVIRCSAYGEVILLAVYARNLQGTKFIKHEGYFSLLISTIVISLILFTFTMCYPYYRLQEMVAPMYNLTTLIQFGRFFTRIDSIFLFIWIIGSLIGVSLLFYTSIWLYCKVFRINDKRPVILAGCVILFLISLLQIDIISVVTENIGFIRNFGFIPYFIIPLLALIVAVIRRKKGEGNETKSEAKAQT
jgi:spore germination protein (amino acid permease)